MIFGRKVEYGGYTTTVYLKRNMAGGEKKRVSEIERERGQVQQMKLEPMAFSDKPASGELQYKELSKQENPIVGEEVAAEYVGEMEEEVEEKTSGYLYLLYRNGKGEDKTLSQLGLLRKIKDAVKNNQEITKEKGDGSIQDRFINQMKAGDGTSFLNSYDFTKVKFALGKATVGGTFDGIIHRNDNGTTHFDGTITYQFYDKFTDPYDLFNAIPPDWNPDGKPYTITGQWTVRIKGDY